MDLSREPLKLVESAPTRTSLVLIESEHPKFRLLPHTAESHDLERSSLLLVERRDSAFSLGEKHGSSIASALGFKSAEEKAADAEAKVREAKANILLSKLEKRRKAAGQLTEPSATTQPTSQPATVTSTTPKASSKKPGFFSRFFKRSRPLSTPPSPLPIATPPKQINTHKELIAHLKENPESNALKDTALKIYSSLKNDVSDDSAKQAVGDEILKSHNIKLGPEALDVLHKGTRAILPPQPLAGSVEPAQTQLPQPEDLFKTPTEIAAASRAKIAADAEAAKVSAATADTAYRAFKDERSKIKAAGAARFSGDIRGIQKMPSPGFKEGRFKRGIAAAATSKINKPRSKIAAELASKFRGATNLPPSREPITPVGQAVAQERPPSDITPSAEAPPETVSGLGISKSILAKAASLPNAPVGKTSATPPTAPITGKSPQPQITPAATTQPAEEPRAAIPPESTQSTPQAAPEAKVKQVAARAARQKAATQKKGGELKPTSGLEAGSRVGATRQGTKPAEPAKPESAKPPEAVEPSKSEQPKTAAPEAKPTAAAPSSASAVGKHGLKRAKSFIGGREAAEKTDSPTSCNKRADGGEECYDRSQSSKGGNRGPGAGEKEEKKSESASKEHAFGDVGKPWESIEPLRQRRFRLVLL